MFALLTQKFTAVSVFTQVLRVSKGLGNRERGKEQLTINNVVVTNLIVKATRSDWLHFSPLIQTEGLRSLFIALLPFVLVTMRSVSFACFHVYSFGLKK
jgi:hypothetical protein